MKNNPAQIIIKNVRFSYVHVFEKDEKNDKYTCCVLIPKNSPQIEDIKRCIQAANQIGVQKGKLTGAGVPWADVLHDGDTAGKDDYVGYWYLKAKSKNKPGVVKVNPTGVGGKTMAITDESEFYSGCYGWADLGFFAFNTGVNKGISVGLNNVLKTGGEDGLGNGQYMGGRSSAESVFGAEIEADDLPGGDDDLV